jgi:alkylation response protein AidB-like acyl-CoA dehydrogenase
MLSPSEDQQLLRDSAARLVREAARWPSERTWKAMTDLGWLALVLEEKDGGLGGSVADLCALTVELGRGLMVRSYTLGMILPAGLVSGAPRSELRGSLLGELVSGSGALAVADVHPALTGVAPSRLVAYEGPAPGSWMLRGQVSSGGCAGETRKLLVCADGAGGELLAVADLGSAGLTAQARSTVDSWVGLDCVFADVVIPASAVLIAPAREVGEVRQRAWDRTSIVMVAECVGMMKALIERTAEHLRTRHQFGKPLVQFQVLRHRMADMALAARRAEVLADRVAGQFATFDAGERTRMVAAACVKGLAGLRFVAEQAIQLHGGMGISAELPVGSYLRRSIALEATFGSPEQHRIRFQESAS